MHIDTKRAGRLAARYIKAKAAGALLVDPMSGRPIDPVVFAKKMRWTHAEILEAAFDEELRGKTAVGSMTTVGASLRTVGQDLAAVVRPLTVIGRLQGFRRVPPQIACLTQTAAAVGYWGDQGAGVSLSAAAFEREILSYERVGAISVVTRELAMSADPDSESTILRDLVGACVEERDVAFLDPENAGSPEVLPASVTRYCPQFDSTGTAVAQIDSDLQRMLQALSDNGSDLTNAAWVMNPRSAGYLAGLRGSGGAQCFPGMGALGGQLLGLPALTSRSCRRSGSPEETFIALIDASRIWLTEADAFELSTSLATDLQMVDDASADAKTGGGTTMISMFQTESVAVKAIGRINWKPMTANSAAVVLQKVNF